MGIDDGDSAFECVRLSLSKLQGDFQAELVEALSKLQGDSQAELVEALSKLQDDD